MHNMNAIVEWLDADALSEQPDIKSRNQFAQKNHSHDPSTLVEKYTQLSIFEMKSFLRTVLKELGVELHGVGVELGAGIGGISNSLLSLCPAIEKIYAVEIVPDVVRLLQSKVTQSENNQTRLVPVIGSFDDIKLPDNSVDFIIEYDSLHHSYDLPKTLREAARILKPGGFIIALDRMHFNALSDAQRDYMLNVEYGEAFKKEYGIPLDTRLTRGQNGEHEIREREWRAAFEQASLNVKKCIMLHRKSFRGFVFAFISQIPFSIRVKYKFYPMLCRFPVSFLMFYCLPFLPILWSDRFREMKITFSRRQAFMSKTVMLAVKIKG